jgi:hypothetical protein
VHGRPAGQCSATDTDLRAYATPSGYGRRSYPRGKHRIQSWQVSAVNLGIAGLVVGIGGIVIGAVVAIVVAIWQRRPKRMVYDLSTNRRIVTGTTYQTSGVLRVMYGRRKLDDPHIIVVRVANDGKVEVRPEDWQEPFTLNTGSEIIDSDVVDTSSKSINASIIGRELHKIYCNKMLMNAGEWFDVQMLVDGPGGISDASARIAGATLTPVGRAKNLRSQIGLWAVVGVVVVGLLVAGAFTSVGRSILHGSVGNVENQVQLQLTVVPTLIGKPVSEVVPDLHKAKLHLGNQQSIPSSVAAGIVIDQYPGAGTILETGAQVSIVIAQHG